MRSGGCGTLPEAASASLGRIPTDSAPADAAYFAWSNVRPYRNNGHVGIICERRGGMAISTRTRFEVLKRDGFTCKYCGRNADDGVKLHVDHIIAVANGGSDDLTNLITACQDCNLGKSSVPLRDIKLPDPTEAARRLAAATEYEEQSQRLAEIVMHGSDLVFARWESWWNGRPTYPYPNAVRAWVRDFGTAEVLEAVDKSCEKCDRSADAVKYFAGIMRNKKLERDAPPLCLICDETLGAGEEHICDDCEERVRLERLEEDNLWTLAIVAAEDEIATEVKAWDDLAEAAGL